MVKKPKLQKRPHRYTGSVYRRPRSPYWWGQVTIDGKRVAKAFTRNKASSLELLRAERLAAKDNKNVKTWEWYKSFFMENLSADRKESTIKRYVMTFNAVDRILKPKKLSDFTVENLTLFRNTLKKEADAGGFSCAGINKYITNLKTVLKTAMEEGHVTGLKLFVLKRFTVTTKPLKIHDMWQLVIMKYYFRPVYKAYGFLCCRAGLRPEEPRTLLKSSLDWEDKSGMIQAAEENKKMGILEFRPKRNHIRPFCFKDAELYAALEALPQTSSPYLLSTRYNEPFTSSGATSSWKKEVKRVNNEIEDIYKNKARKKEKDLLKLRLGKFFTDKPIKMVGNLKDLRKTFATHLEESENAKESQIRVLMGHRPKGITDTHYFVKNFKKAREIIKYLPEIKIV